MEKLTGKDLLVMLLGGELDQELQEKEEKVQFVLQQMFMVQQLKKEVAA